MANQQNTQNSNNIFFESETCLVVSNYFWPCGLYSPWNSPGQNTGEGSLSLLQGIFPTQGSNPGLLHCRWILYQLSYEGKPPPPRLFKLILIFLIYSTRKLYFFPPICHPPHLQRTKAAHSFESAVSGFWAICGYLWCNTGLRDHQEVVRQSPCSRTSYKEDLLRPVRR